MFLLFVPRYPEYEYGDVLRVTGKLETPTQLGDFDYKGYLEHQGIYATMPSTLGGYRALRNRPGV